MGDKEKIALQPGVYVGGNSTFIIDSVSVREVDPVTGELGPELIDQITPINEHMFWGPELITDENRGTFVQYDPMIEDLHKNAKTGFPPAADWGWTETDNENGGGRK